MQFVNRHDGDDPQDEDEVELDLEEFKVLTTWTKSIETFYLPRAFMLFNLFS